MLRDTVDPHEKLQVRGLMMPSGHPDAQKLGRKHLLGPIARPPPRPDLTLCQWVTVGPVTEGWGKAKHR